MDTDASLVLVPALSWLLLRSVLLSGEVSELWNIVAGGEVAIGLEALAELTGLARVLCVRGSFVGSGSGFSSMFVSVPSASAGTLWLVAVSEEARVVFHCSVLPSASSVCGTSKRGVPGTWVYCCVEVRVAVVKSMAVGPLAIALLPALSALPAGGLDGTVDRAVSCR